MRSQPLNHLFLPPSLPPSLLHTETLARLQPTLQSLIFPFAGAPPSFLQYCSSSYPYLSLHNLHHNAPPTAEMGLALLLAAAKLLLPADQQLRHNDWKAGGGPSLAITLQEEDAGMFFYPSPPLSLLPSSLPDEQQLRQNLHFGSYPSLPPSLPPFRPANPRREASSHFRVRSHRSSSRPKLPRPRLGMRVKAVKSSHSLPPSLPPPPPPFFLKNK